jgi:hypothetical protein
MTDRVYVNEEDEFWISNYGTDKVQFNKQSAPPVALLNKGVLYELVDGHLYYNGRKLGYVDGPVGGGTENAIVRWGNGEEIKDSKIILNDKTFPSWMPGLTIPVPRMNIYWPDAFATTNGFVPNNPNFQVVDHWNYNVITGTNISPEFVWN